MQRRREEIGSKLCPTPKVCLTVNGKRQIPSVAAAFTIQSVLGRETILYLKAEPLQLAGDDEYVHIQKQCMHQQCLDGSQVI